MRLGSMVTGTLPGVIKRSVAVFLIMIMLFGCAMDRRNAGSASAADLRIGISYGHRLLSMSADELAAALDDAVEIGARWVRFDIPWSRVQPDSPDSYIWDPFDRIVTQANRRGLQSLPILTYAPAWARSAGCSNDHCPPTNPEQFASFAGAAADRYSQRGVHTWEIWNEPNNSNFWQPSADPVSYARLLQASSDSIRKADSDAFVLLGGLATLETADGNLSIADFLSRSPQNPLQFVDALAVHPYTFPYSASSIGPWASPMIPGNSGLPYIRQALADLGRPNLPIWITEYGAPTGGPGPAWVDTSAPLETSFDHVTEAQQAAMATDAVATAAADPIIDSLFWYTDRDFVSSPDSNENYFGLRRADGSKKPAFAALTQAVRALVSLG